MKKIWLICLMLASFFCFGACNAHFLPKQNQPDAFTIIEWGGEKSQNDQMPENYRDTKNLIK